MVVRFLHGIDAINQWVGNITGYLVFVIVGITLFELLSRSLFETSQMWVRETTIFVFIAFLFLAGGYDLLHRRHVTMDLLYSKLSAKRRAAVDIVACLFLFAFCGLLLWQSLDFVAYSWRVREFSLTPWGPPLYPVKVIMPIGLVLFLLQGVAKFTRSLGTLVGKDWEYHPEIITEKPVRMAE